MNELQVFNNAEFGEIRTVDIDGKPYAIGNDVARALGYKDTINAIKSHCRGVVKHHLIDKMGRQQKMNVIPEGDIYRLIVNSQLPAAEKFERWVFDEVLPTLWRTGTYTAKGMTDYQRIIADTREKNIRVRSALILERLAGQYDGTYKQVLHAYATKELTGEYLLPLPRLGAKTYSATELGERFGISANMVGILANRHNLKTDEYGAFFNDKAKGHNKEVQSFRYYEAVVPVMESLLKCGNET